MTDCFVKVLVKEHDTIVVRETQVVKVSAQPTMPGPPGPQGPAGPPGVSPTGADLNKTHVQAAAAAIWVVAHGLGKRPSVTVVDSAGDPVEGTVAYVDANNLTISFSAAFGGEAYLN
jgi:hypothetical protein